MEWLQLYFVIYENTRVPLNVAGQEQFTLRKDKDVVLTQTRSPTATLFRCLMQWPLLSCHYFKARIDTRIHIQNIEKESNT